MCGTNTLRILFERRSIRSFKEVQIGNSDLDTILGAAKYAPSAMNEQLWHFTVIQNKEILNRINTISKELYGKSGNPKFEERAKAENFSLFYHAPTYIIVSVDEKAIAPQEDGALALGNAFLAAEALGIGSCWIHAVKFLYSTSEGKQLLRELGIPEGYIPIGSGAFGYSAAEKPEPAARREGVVNFLR